MKTLWGGFMSDNGDVPQHHTGLTKKILEDVHLFLLPGAGDRSWNAALTCVLNKTWDRTKVIDFNYKKNIRPIESQALLYQSLRDNPNLGINLIEQEYAYARSLPWVVLKDEQLGFKYAIATTGMGPSSAAIVMRELTRVVEPPFYCIRPGTGGTMQPNIHFGDYVIATGAIRAESASYKYVTSRDDPYVPLASPIVTAALGLAHQKITGKLPHVGVKISKDELDWEVGDVPMKLYQREWSRECTLNSVKTSSMESSIIYTILDRYSHGLIDNPQNLPERTAEAGTIISIVNNYETLEGEAALFDKAAMAKSFPQVQNTMMDISLEALRILFKFSNNQMNMEELKQLSTAQDIIIADTRNYTNTIRYCENKLHEIHPRW